MIPNNITETYGELLPESMTKLLRIIPMSEHDVFLDLGSGKGKIVMQVFTQTRCSEARGIEISPHLHADAERSKAPIEANNRVLRFSRGDFFNIPFTGATVVLIASPCFGPSMLHSLGNKINETPSIHTVLSLRPIATLTHLSFKKIIKVECSWDSALCYVYRLN